MTLYGGIDLHANNSMVTLLDEQDHVVYQKRMANQLDVILGHLAPYQGEITGLVHTATIGGKIPHTWKATNITRLQHDRQP